MDIMHRKEFIEKLGRGILLTSLASLTAYSLLKQQKGNYDICDINPACAGCYRFAGCKKPQAVKQRNHEKE